MVHWYDHNQACPQCGQVRRITISTLKAGWPIRCKNRYCRAELQGVLPKFEEPEVPQKWRDRAQPERRFWQRCYEMAGKFMLGVIGYEYLGPLHDAVLVHGSCKDDGFRFAHAWVELPGDIIFDGVWQRFLRKEDYIRLRDAVEVVRYTEPELVAMTVECGTWGPWTVEAQLAGMTLGDWPK